MSEKDYFSAENKERLNEVRKELYSGGLTGLLIGSAVGGIYKLGAFYKYIHAYMMIYAIPGIL